MFVTLRSDIGSYPNRNTHGRNGVVALQIEQKYSFWLSRNESRDAGVILVCNILDTQNIPGFDAEFITAFKLGFPGSTVQTQALLCKILRHVGYSKKLACMSELFQLNSRDNPLSWSQITSKKGQKNIFIKQAYIK